MNIQEIDKWLDNEYGVSYTRLEELHDFVVEQDLKHREEAEKEIERLNKRINELEDRLEKQRNNELEKLAMKAARLGIPSRSLKKLQELKGDDKE